MSQTVIKNNVLQGVVWDGQAIEAINNISKAILNLTELLKSQNIKITMIHVDGNTKKEEDGEKV